MMDLALAALSFAIFAAAALREGTSFLSVNDMFGLSGMNFSKPFGTFSCPGP
jgi:hypothetical protein